MIETRFQIVKRLLGEALERSPEERLPWLRLACGEDDALYGEVARLLLAPDAGSLDFVGHLTATVVKEDLAGVRLGAWRLVRELGQGGMGTVWLAERDDELFEMKAAVKLVSRERLYPALVGRFRRERQILANLTHPNIAGLLDGGTTTDGRPYLIMEYVDGLPVDAWCSHHQASRDRIVEIVLCLCEAVTHAHRKGVIHRDIKCSNVLVTEVGHVKLMDFGIARLVEGSQPRDLVVTATGEMPMTPEFAAPEQLAGRMATRQSDIHGLGLVLFQLLTGLRPRDVVGTPYEALQQPLPLHARQFGDSAEPLPPALRTVLMRALAPNLQDRYAAVDQMSAALEAWLERHEGADRAALAEARREAGPTLWQTLPGQGPLAALLLPDPMPTDVSSANTPGAGTEPAPEAEAEHLDKPAVAFPFRLLAALLAVLLIGTLPLFLAARREAAVGRQQEAFLDRCLAPEQRSLLGEASAFGSGHLDRLAEALERHGELDPEVRARLYQRLAQALAIGQRQDAAAAALESALGLWRALDRPEKVAATLEQLAWVELARGGISQALASITEADLIARALSAQQRAPVLRTLGWLQFRHGDEGEAGANLLEALRLAQLTGLDQALSADCLARLGELRRSQEQWPQAEPLLRDALRRWRELEGPLHPRVADCLEQLAAVLQARDQGAAALPLLREALAIRRNLLGPEDPAVTRLNEALTALEASQRAAATPPAAATGSER